MPGIVDAIMAGTGCIAAYVSGAAVVLAAVSQSEVLGRFYNPNTTPKDKE